MKNLLLLAAISLVGCLPDPPMASSPTLSRERATDHLADGLADLTSGDCQAWADHFAVRLREATQRRVAECDRQAGGAVSTDDKDLEVADVEVERLHGLIIEQCGQQLGAAYPREDAACYLGAKQMEDWGSCKFKSAFFSDYAAVAKNHRKLFDERCRRAIAAKTGS